MPYQLIRDRVSHDLVLALETLLEGAKSGEITGMAFACTLKRMRFFTNVAGVCYRNPTFSRGLLAALDDELAAMVHMRDTEETR